jgi:hypothetical protein
MDGKKLRTNVIVLDPKDGYKRLSKFIKERSFNIREINMPDLESLRSYELNKNDEINTDMKK